MPTYGDYINSKSAQTLPVPGTKLIDLVDPSTGVVTKTPVSNIGGGNPVVQTITFAASIAFNVVNGKWGRLTLTGNVTAWTFSGLVAGDCGILRIFQDATGGRTIAWPGTAVIASGGIALSSGANELTEIGYVYDGVTLTLQKQGYGAVAPDVTAPVLSSATIADASKDYIDLAYNETLNGASIPAIGDFTVPGKTIIGVTMSGAIIVRVQVSVPFVYGDTPTISYTAAANPIEDSAGNNAANLVAQAVTNNIAGAGYDADAQAYFDVLTASTTGFKNATDALFVGLKTDGLFSKVKVLRLYRHGANASAANHKWNAKNPLDTDGAFRATFHGGITHNGTGVAGNGSTGYIDNKIIPNTDMTLNNVSGGAYLNTANSSNGRAFGCNVGDGRYHELQYSGGSYYGFLNSATAGTYPDSVQASHQGHVAITRTGAAVCKLFKNGAQIGATATTTNDKTQPNYSIYSLAVNADGAASAFLDNEISYEWHADGLNDTEMANINTRLETWRAAT